MRSQSLFNSTSTSPLRGQTTGNVGADRLSKAEKAKSVNRVTSAHMLSQHALSRLKERPRLIAELADTHRTVNGLMLSVELLKQIARSVVEIKRLVSLGAETAADLNSIDVYKRDIMNAVNSQLFGRHILDSSFAPSTTGIAEIEFQVPGLDLVRERLTNELVTLYINNKMIPLAFDRVESNEGLFDQFATMFSFGQMRLRRDDQYGLMIAMPDYMWRKWDLQIYVSGQGGRYPEGNPITVAAQSRYATVEMVTMLDIRAKDAIEAIDRVISRVNDMHSYALEILKSQDNLADKLISYCHTATAETGLNIKALFESNGVSALKAIQKHYVGPNRENVVSLIKKVK
ncbi:hypothetical protein [Vibrio ziniensis]|uniref:hypothetical protein n=1 Tax=Vibrio ziniensis TaxID=2711221 RepID=UPI001A992D0E|nr:hypothetical protein [Vibrio ziniensis]